ncbi:hypothetical protein MtrunA17_Chr4g0035291 [Medicago truncatula]|uniref:Transmembrane protein, putative n=1 Tax=Medicago truncatula TaxID=3880 RepID=G7JHE9_MEDTR|nr:uncharacterized protein LOC11415990 [Medicago truncatula]AES89159.1 transmembrane protein, putative [Medicago truncatula]RHN61315.1 hypothetical protein MtrunA17_Chr4g0035291 [Medicago truncatula]
MESFRFNLQVEKANAILKHRKLQRVTILLRLVEVCVVLVLISRLSLKLLVVVRNSSEYLRDVSVIVNSHYFVFVIGNVIIITLFAQGSGKNVPKEHEHDDIYEKLVHNSVNHEEKERIIKDDRIVEKGGSLEQHKMKREVKKSYRRCETNILKKRRRVLERCESENERKIIEAATPAEEEMLRISYPEDEMSNDEFRRIVEAFIAKQQRGFEG